MLNKVRLAALAAVAALAAAGSALAAPYSTTYTGTIGGSTHPDAISGQTYDVTLVFDNGGASALSQTWGQADLRCVIWRFNTARNFVFTNDLLNDPPNNVSGAVTTDGAGVMTANFTSVTDNDGLNPANYTVSGGTGIAPIAWFANDANGVFYDDSFAREIEDAAGGTDMAPANWSNPVPFSGNCAGLVLGTPPATVPTLSDFALWLMTLSLMVAGFFYTRRWATA